MAELPPGSSMVAEEKTSRNEDEDRLKALRAEATLKYSIHDYDEAAELYSQATELQAELNGEMSSLNADLLYQYGRCLYHVAVRKSDVLGPKVAEDKPEEGSLGPSGTRQLNKRTVVEKAREDTETTREALATSSEEAKGLGKSHVEPQKENKPFFQFTGDENFEGPDEDDGGGGTSGDEDAENEEDDFANAYEVLDLARILLLRRLEETQGRDMDSLDLKHLRERLADTYDLQAEISLEGERFSSAVIDLKAALELKQILFPPQSSLIAEAHYKLSLALEFSSMTEQKGVGAKLEEGAQETVDQGLREAAAKEMDAAIESCKLRLDEEEAKVKATSSDDSQSLNSAAAIKNIKEVREIVNDMEQRLIELRQPPVSINGRTGVGDIEGLNPQSGILSSILSESPEVQRMKLEAASIGAADLTNLIKRKSATTTDGTEETTEANVLKSNGKRKAEVAHEDVDVGLGKKAKLSDTGDE